MQNTKNRDFEKPPGKSSRAKAPAPADDLSAQLPPKGSGSQLVAWLLSPTVRHATAMRKHVQKLLNHQRDILSPQAIQAIEGGVSALQRAVMQGSAREALEKQMENLEKAANDWLKPYPNAAWRENIEVLLVALTIAMGIRTFFLQPFKIPTGSMQPTLFGVTSVPDYSHSSLTPGADNSTAVQHPPFGQMVKEWFGGVSYIDLKSKVDGEFQGADAPFRILIFNIYQKVYIGGVAHWLWFPPDYGSATLEQRAGLSRGTEYRKGDQVI